MPDYVWFNHGYTLHPSFVLNVMKRHNVTVSYIYQFINADIVIKKGLKVIKKSFYFMTNSLFSIVKAHLYTFFHAYDYNSCNYFLSTFTKTYFLRDKNAVFYIFIYI